MIKPDRLNGLPRTEESVAQESSRIPQQDMMGDRLKAEATSLVGNALRVSLGLFRIMIPVVVAVKAFQELDLIRYLALPLKPVMGLVGLPGEMGLVWATAMVNNLYGGVIVLLSLIPDASLSTAQITTLCTMMLVAHSLPVELRIAQKSGPRLPFQALSRVGWAFFLGWALHAGFTYFQVLQQPAEILLQPRSAADTSLIGWALGQAVKLLFIFLVILGLLVLMRILETLGIIQWFNRILGFFLKAAGIGEKATAVTVIGLTLGISYGGGLIIQEARSGKIGKEDVFYSLTLMGLCHALIEDTLLMLMVGAHVSGVLWARLLFSALVAAGMVKATRKLPDRLCDRLLWAEPA